jgi:type IV pilus assembly protein PilV
MNGGWLPMLGGPARKRERQNACVKKSLPLRSPAPFALGSSASSRGIAPRFASSVAPRTARLGVLRLARPPMSRRAAGFTLIEVLVALIVLVLGVLGAAAMTLSSLKDSKQSGLRAQATALAYQLGDLMRANPGQVLAFTTTTPAAVSSCWISNGCTPAQMAQNDYFEWQLQAFGNGTTIPGVLPNGSGKVCQDSGAPSGTSTTAMATYFTASCDNATTSPIVVKLKWDEKNNNARGATSSTPATTVYFNMTLQPY